MIIGSVFTIAGGALPVHGRADPAAGGKISMFWPLMFELCNSIGFAHVLPVSLALFSKIAPKRSRATVIGLYYLAFFVANKVVGYVGGLYSSLPTTTFWLIHVASAVFGLVAFVVFKVVVGQRMATGSRGRRRRRSAERSSETDFGDLFLHACFGFAAEQLVDRGLEEAAEVAQPDLGVVELEADERHLGVVFAVVPFGDDCIPQPVDRPRGCCRARAAAQTGENVMTLADEAGDGAVDPGPAPASGRGPWR